MDEQVAAFAGANGAVPPARPGKKRALIVDDNLNETRLLASYLELKGIEVHTAHDGAEAINYLSAQVLLDAVLLDMQMPRFDGPWTVKEIRSRNRYDDLNIYAVSGMDPCDYNVALGPQGINHWFSKPLNPETLIDQLLSQERQAALVAQA